MLAFSDPAPALTNSGHSSIYTFCCGRKKAVAQAQSNTVLVSLYLYHSIFTPEFCFGPTVATLPIQTKALYLYQTWHLFDLYYDRICRRRPKQQNYLT
jgi:hypothetical protein